MPLPHGVGKTVRVVVFCQGDNVAKAKEAGADFAGSDDLIEKIQKQNWLDFDVALATQDMMGKVSRLGKVLGPRGLMPTPKAGTVVPAGGDVAAAVARVQGRQGRVPRRQGRQRPRRRRQDELRRRTSWSDNMTAFVEQIRAAKPTGVKGHYITSVTLSATMSPGIPVARCDRSRSRPPGCKGSAMSKQIKQMQMDASKTLRRRARHGVSVRIEDRRDRREQDPARAAQEEHLACRW